MYYIAGFGDSLENEESHIDNLVTALRDKIRYIHAFVIAFKQQDNRMSKSLRSMIGLFQKMFGDAFWENAILEATHWNYGERVSSYNHFFYNENSMFKLHNFIFGQYGPTAVLTY